MAKITGNRSSWNQQRGSVIGLGRENKLLPGSWTAVSGEASEVVYLSLNQLAPSIMQMGCYVQATAAVKLEYSLQPIEIATDPNNQNSVFWGNSQTLAASTVVETDPILFTCVKITFTNAADVFFYSR